MHRVVGWILLGSSTGDTAVCRLCFDGLFRAFCACLHAIHTAGTPLLSFKSRPKACGVRDEVWIERCWQPLWLWES
jgi:hypothetical protein